MANIIVDMIDGTRRRYDTDKLDNLNYSTPENHGVKITGVRRTRGKPTRIIVGTYSIWGSSRQDGTVVGQSYHEAGEYEISRLADHIDALVEMVPAGN